MDEWIALGCPSIVEPTYPQQISSSPGLYLYWVFDNLEAWMKTRPDYIGVRLDYREDVLDPAVFLAAEAFHACVCDILPSYRSLRGCKPLTIHTNAAMLVALVFIPKQVKDTSKSPRKGVISNLSMMSVSEFQRLAIMSLVPGSPGNVKKRDFVFSFNGYVAFASPVQKISTIPRECVSISIVPGVIRWGEDNATFDRIREIHAYISPNQTSENRPVEVFDHEGIQYLGLEPRIDESSLEIESLISASGRTLLLRTYMRPSQRQNRMVVEVDWLNSINAVAVSIQVNEQDMLPAAEEALAKMWLKEYVWARMTWVPAHGEVTAARFKNAPSPQIRIYNYLSMTYGDERLRFFLAGRCKSIKKYMRQGSTPLMQCVRAALAASLGERRDLPTRQRPVVDSPAAKGEQSNTTTLQLPSGVSKSRILAENWIVIS